MKVKEFLEFCEKRSDKLTLPIYCRYARECYGFINTAHHEDGRLILGGSYADSQMRLDQLYLRIEQLKQQYPKLPDCEIVYRTYSEWSSFKEIKQIAFADGPGWCLAGRSSGRKPND